MGNWRWIGDRICSQGSFGSLPSRAGGDEPYSASHLSLRLAEGGRNAEEHIDECPPPMLPGNQLREAFPVCLPGARAASGNILIPSTVVKPMSPLLPFGSQDGSRGET